MALALILPAGLILPPGQKPSKETGIAYFSHLALLVFFLYSLLEGAHGTIPPP